MTPVLNGIFWVLGSGAPWRDLPERYGPHTTCHNRFVRWRKAGVWDQLMDAITAAHEGDIQMIDSTSVRAHQQAATAKKGEWEEAIGRSREGRTCKIHCLADDSGRPVAFSLTPGNIADISMAIPLLSVARPARRLIADSLRNWLKQRCIKAVIPSTASRRTPYPLDKSIYRRRNVIEQLFCRLKNWRRIATRYDRYATNYLAGIALVAAVDVWLI